MIPGVHILQVRQLFDFAEALGFAVDEYASSKGRIPPRARRRRNTLFIATIEKVPTSNCVCDVCVYG